MSRLLWLGLCLVLPAPSASLGQDEPVFEGQPLRDWVQSLKKGDDQARRHAAQVLGVMGPGAEAAIPDLAAALADAVPAVRQTAASSLAGMGSVAVPALLKTLHHKEARARAAAALGLAELRRQAAAAAPALQAALNDPDPEVRLVAAVALWHVSRQGRAVLPVLRAALDAKEDEFRDQAFFTLTQIARVDSAAVPALEQALQVSVPSLRKQAAQALGRLGAAAAPAVPSLLNVLNFGDADLREHAALALGQIGPPARSAAFSLGQILWSQKRRELHWTATVIGLRQAPAWVGLPMLLRPRAPESARLPEYAVWALRQIGPEGIPHLAVGLRDDPLSAEIAEALRFAGPAAVSALSRVLDDPDAYVRAEAAGLLGQIGPEARAARPLLRALLQDEYALVRVRAAGALWRIDRQAGPVLPVVRESLKREAALIRLYAVRLLGDMGPAAEGSIPWLAEAVKDKDGEVRKAALDALTARGPDALAAAGVPPRGSDDSIRASWWRALGSIAPQGDKTVAFLCKELQDPEFEVREAAAERLSQLGPLAEAALPALLAAAEDERPAPRRVIFAALGRVGRGSRAAAEALVKGLEIRDETLQNVVMSALCEIGPVAIPPLRKVWKDLPADLRYRASWHVASLGSEGVQLLRELVSDTDPRVRLAAAQRLAWCPGQADALLPVFLADLRDPKSETHGQTIVSLSSLGAHAGRILPALQDYLAQAGDLEWDWTVEVLEAIGPDAAPVLRQALRRDDLKQRLRAAQALCGLEGQAAVVLPVLLAALKDADEKNRGAAVGLLGQLGPDARPAMPAVRRALYDDSPEVRVTAALALARIDPGNADSLAILLKALRQAGEFGPEALRGPGIFTEDFTPELRRFGARAMPALIEMLTGDDLPIGPLLPSGDLDRELMRARAAAVLGRMGPEARAAVPALLGLLKTHDPFAPSTSPEILDGLHPYTARGQAAHALGQMGPAAQVAVPALIALLREALYQNHPPWAAEAEAARDGRAGGLIREPLNDGLLPNVDPRPPTVLAQLGPVAEEALPALRQIMKDENHPWRALAAVAVWKIARQPAEVVPVLVKALQEGDWQGLATFREMGAAAKDAVPALRKLLHPWLDLGGHEVPADDGPVIPEVWVIETLGRIGPAARSAWPELRLALVAGNRYTRVAAAAAMVRIDPSNPEALPVLLTALAGPAEFRPDGAFAEYQGPDEPSTSHEAAAIAVGELGVWARAAIPLLRNCLELHREPARVAAAEALWRIDGHAAVAVPVLVQALRRGWGWNAVRPAAAQALGRMGPAAKDALPALREALRDDEPAVRKAAAEALRRITSAADRPDGP
jgi:HEAT repeat protein